MSSASNITSASVCSARSSSYSVTNKLAEEDTVLKKKLVMSAHLSRRAEAIKSILLSTVGLSEVQIREFLGDSPDTSKALRMCVFFLSLIVCVFYLYY